MAGPAIQFMSPVGRLVQGHPLIAQPKTDDDDKPIIDQATGKQETSYYLALAFPKSDPEFAKLWAVMQQVGQRDFPSGEYQAPTFAWKVIDGDGFDKTGKPNNKKQGFAGNFIIRVTSGYAFPVVNSPDAGQMPITDPEFIKRGYYGRVHLMIKGNDSKQSPGIYLNPSFYQHIAYGEVIHSGPDVAAILAQHAGPIALPPGASATPIAAATPAGMSSMPGLPGLPGAPLQAAPAAMPGLPSLPGMAAGAATTTVPGLPGLPRSVAPPAMPAIAPAVDPMAGWTRHPQSPTHFYRGNELKTEAEIRAAVAQPYPAILQPPR